MLSFCSCSVDSESYKFVDSENYYFSSRIWKTKSKEKSIILAIHGYNDYSNSFDSPANFLSKYQTSVFSFDLRGFGSNQNKGEWFPLEVHINDVEFYLKKIKKKFPDRKLFLLGESMGGAIVVSTLKKNPKISLDGVILVAPAIWNFSEKNPVKKTILEMVSSFLPNLKLKGENFIKVKASDNIEMLKELSKDEKFIHKPTLKSLNGVIDLMDTSYLDMKKYLNKPTHKTLIIIPIKDEIVPRKPLMKILRENSKSISSYIDLAVFKNHYHMILRDNAGDNVSYAIMEWLENSHSGKSFHKSLELLENSKFYHLIER